VPRRLVTPLAWISRRMGRTFAAYRADASRVALTGEPADGIEVPLAAVLGSPEGLLGPLRDERPLLLGERGV
jgi:hypothetical protein